MQRKRACGMTLALVVSQQEALTVGKAVLRMKVRADGRIQVWIDAPLSVDVVRESAIKKVAS